MLEPDIKKALEAGEAMYKALKQMPCTCIREFKYHGKSVEMCRRCRAMVLWEYNQQTESPTQKRFDTYRT